jgi:hypothetical protein
MAFSFSRLIISESDGITCKKVFEIVDRINLQAEQRGTATCVGKIGGNEIWLGFTRMGLPTWKCSCTENIYTRKTKPCSHTIALSIVWDRSRGVPDPSLEDIEYLTRKY